MVKIKNNNHIVMVDDSEIDFMLMKRYISKSKLTNEFQWFNSGEQFLAYMDEIKQGVELMPALVFLDINMPQMNGLDVLKTLREDSMFEELPVVMILTNSDHIEDIEYCKALGTDIQEKFRDTESAIHFLNSLT